MAGDEDILSLVDRWGYAACFGHLRGVFPAMACDPESPPENRVRA